MSFTAAAYDVDGRLFQPQQKDHAREKQGTKLSPAEEIQSWRTKAEEISRRYQELLRSYKQLKAAQKDEQKSQQHIRRLLNDSLSVCDDLQRAVDAARCQAADPVVDALITGIEQVLEKQLGQLCVRGLLEAIEPQPSELFDSELHEACGTVKCDLAEGLIAEVADPGYLCGMRVIRKAKVLLSGTESA